MPIKIKSFKSISGGPGFGQFVPLGGIDFEAPVLSGDLVKITRKAIDLDHPFMGAQIKGRFKLFQGEDGKDVRSGVIKSITFTQPGEGRVQEWTGLNWTIAQIDKELRRADRGDKPAFLDLLQSEPLTWTIVASAGRGGYAMGSDGVDRVRGSQRGDQMFSGDGDDRIDGRGGDDYFDGGRGDDRLFGGAGVDFLAGERGTDQLCGGKGADNVNVGAGAVLVPLSDLRFPPDDLARILRSIQRMGSASVGNVWGGAQALVAAQIADALESTVLAIASPDGAAAAIAELFDRLDVPGLCTTLVASDENLGFGAACNLGAEGARGRYVLMLNPDTVVLRRGVERLVEHQRDRADIGVDHRQRCDRARRDADQPLHRVGLAKAQAAALQEGMHALQINARLGKHSKQEKRPARVFQKQVLGV